MKDEGLRVNRSASLASVAQRGRPRRAGAVAQRAQLAQDIGGRGGEWLVIPFKEELP